MQHTRVLEIGVGLFVAAGLAALFVLAIYVSNLAEFTGEDGYVIHARFENVGGLRVRAPVMLAGVRIGRVAAIEIDQHTYEAVVRMSIRSGYELPADSSAAILTAGLLGEQYVGVEPGGDDRLLESGDTIRITQSAIVLERVIGQFLFRALDADGL
jgi:phospholipid/cholesterol/gamma-HCH transport system substrate-binding protein